MRNIFDQYSQNENRLTHAFASALHEDSELRADFINRFLSRGVKPRIGSVRIAEQSYPGFPQMSEQDAEAASIPDIWLYDEDSAWCVVVECKITASLTSGQVQRHIRTARQRGFETILPVTISIAGPHDALPSGTVELRWSMIYEWLHEHSGTSVWATHAARYFETLEAQMAEAGQLGDGTLTTFTGFGFAKPEDYSYPEAKRLLRLALEQLREDKDLINVLGMDPALPGRGAITGSDADGVWDYLQLSQARGAAHHTNHPHLTLGVHRREIKVMVTLPNSMQRPLRGRLKAIGLEGFTELLAQILGRLSGLLSKEPNAIPTVRTVQRRYRTQRSKPFLDAELRFDMRTAASVNGPVKHQTQWAGAAIGAFAHKKSNLQMQMGVMFPLPACETMMSRSALWSISQAWCAHQPLFDLIYGARGAE